ncbi:hypothetical protein TOREUM_40369 [Tenacibaculum litoreum]|uniref:hypothetical protein n=1 Tax=Tenacibaculum litoreum TaxID=321269 RepID=UPI003895C078
MKKSILNLGKALSKAQQKKVRGGEGTVITEAPLPGDECIEGMCSNMVNPDHDWRFGGSGTTFVEGVCRDGRCYYE